METKPSKDPALIELAFWWAQKTKKQSNTQRQPQTAGVMCKGKQQDPERVQSGETENFSGGRGRPL